MTFWSDLMDSVVGRAEPPPAPVASGNTAPPPTMSVLAATEALLALREGRKNVVYLDTRGKATVGIGHLVGPLDHLKVGQVVSDAQVDAFFAKDIGASLAAAHLQCDQAGITDQSFIPYLASVCFQLGPKWNIVLFGVWKYIMAGDYEAAAADVGTTLWARQTPVRAQDFQAALRRLPKKV